MITICNYVCMPKPLCNLFISHLVGMVPPPAYVQPAWTNIAPVSGQAPPAYYATNQGQPIWMIQPAAGNPGAPPAQATDQTKERLSA